MPSHNTTFAGITSAVALTSALIASGNALAQGRVTGMTQQQIHDRIVELCKDQGVRDRLSGSEEICQVSTDGGKTWIWLPAGLLTALGAGGVAYMIRRKRKPATPVSPIDTPDAPGVLPSDSPVDETDTAEEVVVSPTKPIEEIVLETISHLAETDSRFTLENGVVKSVLIGTETYDLSDWTEAGAELDFPVGKYSWKRDGAMIQAQYDTSLKPIRLEYRAEEEDMNNNVTISHVPGIYEVYDASGDVVAYVPGGIIKHYTTFSLNDDGTVSAPNGKKYGTDSTTLIEEYDADGKIVGISDTGHNSTVADILGTPDASIPVTPTTALDPVVPSALPTLTDTADIPVSPITPVDASTSVGDITSPMDISSVTPVDTVSPTSLVPAAPVPATDVMIVGDATEKDTTPKTSTDTTPVIRKNGEKARSKWNPRNWFGGGKKTK